MRTTLFAMALFGAAAPALAQPGPDPAAAAAVMERARARIAASPCPTAAARPAAPPTPIVDATVRTASYHRILIEGCGQRAQRNWVFMVLNDGRRSVLEMLPGNSVADPVLQQDAMRAARLAAQAAVPGCQQVLPLSGEFDGPDAEPGVARRTRPWTETWIMEACGIRLGVPMLFTPTATGTSFTARQPVRRPG